MKQPTYVIGDTVYHVLPDSPQGVVVDGRYSLYCRAWEYLVTFDPITESKWYTEGELRDRKTYN